MKFEEVGVGGGGGGGGRGESEADPEILTSMFYKGKTQ